MCCTLTGAAQKSELSINVPLSPDERMATPYAVGLAACFPMRLKWGGAAIEWGRATHISVFSRQAVCHFVTRSIALWPPVTIGTRAN